MTKKPERISCTFAGITFGGYVLRNPAWENGGEPNAIAYIKVPKPALLKIAKSPNAIITRRAIYTDDYYQDAQDNFQKKENVDPEIFINRVNEHRGTAWVSSISMSSKTLSWCPYQSENWEISEVA